MTNPFSKDVEAPLLRKLIAWKNRNANMIMLMILPASVSSLTQTRIAARPRNCVKGRANHSICKGNRADLEQGQSSRIRDSPTVQMSLVLVSVYLLFGAWGGDFLNLVQPKSPALPFVQDNVAVRQGGVWMLFTSMFLHANLLHLGGNLLFLLIFGTVLEEQVSRKRWLVTFLVCGLLGAAGGARGAIAMIFLLGLNLFAGGGELAHTFGLVSGILLHEWGDSVRLLHGQASAKS